MKPLREAVIHLLDYLWKDEQKHWQESGKPQKHIYFDLIALRDNFDLQKGYPNDMEMDEYND